MRIVTDYKHAQQIIREQDAEIERLRKRIDEQYFQGGQDMESKLLPRIEELEAIIERAMCMTTEWEVRDILDESGITIAAAEGDNE